MEVSEKGKVTEWEFTFSLPTGSKFTFNYKGKTQEEAKQALKGDIEAILKDLK